MIRFLRQKHIIYKTKEREKKAVCAHVCVSACVCVCELECLYAQAGPNKKLQDVLPFLVIYYGP